MAKTKTRITVRDIALAAGVSNASVSRVLNYKGIVTPATYDKILAAMRELGYPFEERQAPPAEENGVVILNIASMENPFFNDVASGAKMAASAHGCQLLVNVEDISQTTMPRILQLLHKVKPVGVIVTNQAEAPLLAKLNEDHPVVQCSEYNIQSPLSYVSIDDFTASKKAVEYLISRGRTKIGFINESSRSHHYKYTAERMRGYLDAMEQAGLTVNEDWILSTPINYDTALASIIQLLNTKDQPDAFFTVSDIYAAAVIRASQQQGLRVPEDIAVIGFDNLNITRMTTPSITTVSQPQFQLGYTACEVLFDHIANPGLPQQTLLLDTELIIRQST